MKAIVWAAGLGTRLRPLTEHQPKAMMPVANTPMLVHALHQCRKAGITDIMINLHYFPDTITSYLGDGSSLGVRLSYSYEEELLENAGAVVKVKDFFDTQEPFVAFASDNLTDINLQAMLSQHKKTGALATLATTKTDDVSKYGVVSCGQDGRIETFQEKPDPAEAKGDLVATCVYVFSPEIFSHLPKTPEKKHFGKEVFPRLLAEKHAVYAYEHTGYWNDIGNPNTYLMANFDTLTQKAKLEISLTEVEPRLYRGEDVYIAPSARIIPPVVIGDRVHIGDNCVIGPFAVIGRGVTIENNSQVERSLINDACHLEEDCLLWESILAKHCHVYKQNQVKNLVLGENSLINKTTL